MGIMFRLSGTETFSACQALGQGEEVNNKVDKLASSRLLVDNKVDRTASSRWLVDKEVVTGTSSILPVNSKVDDHGQNFPIFLFRLGKGFFGHLTLLADSYTPLEDFRWF
ncbi:OLC1v1012944C1 [Oldenlandia corymbosa var. corymbosa]|uniref:OLC1v1012944C1 n=1 Tax=Oldenlandia corymbosa var. corymbosa TaxID=529605 RepID=A0AAV1DZ15_OLDCO|nr:OLC1v1012944C1 [Oldenlandia corymbosa var. corymbosa]